MTGLATDVVTRQRIFGMMQAYKQTSLLRTGIELGVFDALGPEPSDAARLSARLAADPRGMRILLNALAAIGLLELDGAEYRLSPGTEQFLVRGGPDYLGDMVRVMSSDWEWDALKELTAAVRHGGTVTTVNAETPRYQYWEDFASFATAVAEPTARRTAEVLEQWADDRPALDVLDVACGHGLYGYEFAAAHPRARVWSLDWPNVLTITREHAERRGVADRAAFIPGDMFSVPLGGPYDLILLTNVTHHFDEQRVTELLARLRTALKPDGRLVIVGFTVGDEAPSVDPAPHLFSVLMLVWTGGGESHSVASYDRALAAAGYTQATVIPTDLPFRILLADPA
ncbi:MAG TPA: class I SAM-dependent methyltransferase [Streptosporangiaceae bacterium]|nr:class I SAM-dependent methyltransferase [Streptosporangiaceae bacterium]